MGNRGKVIIIKLVHTAVWLVMAAASVYILYAGLTGTESLWLWISIALLVIETAVLIYNRWTCPLTPMAMRYTAERGPNFDIYLPKLVAKYNKIIFGMIFVLGLILVVYNSLSR